LERANWATHEGRREPVFSEERHSAPTVLLKLGTFFPAEPLVGNDGGLVYDREHTYLDRS
jgi:hypothetical protein